MHENGKIRRMIFFFSSQISVATFCFCSLRNLFFIFKNYIHFLLLSFGNSQKKIGKISPEGGLAKSYQKGVADSQKFRKNVG